MEIYKETNTDVSKEFEKLLKNEISKTKDLVEGKIIEGTVTKVGEKYVWCHADGLKSEAMIDINELKTLGQENKLKIGEKIKVLLERIEGRDGEVIVSASKAQKIRGWEVLLKCYEKNEPIIAKFISKTKGGAVVEHIDTGSLMFCPGSQIASSPIKDISALFNEPLKFAIIKVDRTRGNLCVSRRQIIESGKKEDKAKIIEKYKVGDIIKNAVCKGYSSFGAFFNVNNELDCLTHIQELSYSKVTHPEEILNIGDKMDLLVISVDKEKLQIGCSIKQLSPDPFEKISNYELNKTYEVKVTKIMEFGIFAELEPQLIALCHSSEIDWSRKNVAPKKYFKVGDKIQCKITEIDMEKRRIAISHRLTKPNPFEELEKNNPVGTEVSGKISSMNEYAIYLKLDDYGIDSFLHFNDLAYTGVPEEVAKNFKLNDKLKVKVLEIKKDSQKVRVGLKQTQKDPFDFFKDKKINDVVSVKIHSVDNKGLTVKPEGCDLNLFIKKSQIAVASADSRSERFVGGELVDVAISELNFEKRKVSLSMKLLEELQNKEAVSKFSSPLSGKNLPFSSLSDKLSNKKKKN